jgi:hypothetical protein
MTPEYLAQVRQLFLTKSGRGLALSPKDRGIVAQWARAGVPLEVVLRGIEQAFSGAPPKRVRGLSYVAPAVESAMDAWRARKVGGADPSPTVDLEGAFDALMGEIEAVGRVQTDPAKKEVLREAWREIDALRGQWRVDRSLDLTTPFVALSERVCERGLEALDPHARGALDDDVGAALAHERGSSPSVMAETRRAFVWRRVRATLGIPPLELDLGGGW